MNADGGLMARIRKQKDEGWRREHWSTQGRHYGLNGRGSSAADECPLCPRWRFATKDMTGAPA